MQAEIPRPMLRYNQRRGKPDTPRTMRRNGRRTTEPTHIKEREEIVHGRGRSEDPVSDSQENLLQFLLRIRHLSQREISPRPSTPRGDPRHGNPSKAHSRTALRDQKIRAPRSREQGKIRLTTAANFGSTRDRSPVLPSTPSLRSPRNRKI